MAETWTRDGGETWGPWISHDGTGCPLAAGVIVEVVFQDGFGLCFRQISQVEGGSYSSWNWEHFPVLKKILRYREKKPRGLSILEENLRELDAPKDGVKDTPKVTSDER